MKLNNKGWGYTEMIICMAIILFWLIFAAIMISSYYDKALPDNSSGQNEDATINDVIDSDEQEEVVLDKNYYYLQENILKNATLEYVNKYSYDLSEDILTVTMDTLVSFDFMEPIYDQTGNYKCTGYSNVFISGGQYNVIPYISCNNYITSGY